MKRRPLIAGSIAAVVFLALFWELAEGLGGSAVLVSFDAAVSSWVQGFRSPALTRMMIGITHAGDTPAIALASIALFMAISAEGRRFDAAFTGVVVLAGGVLSTLAKGSFARARPPVEGALIDLPVSFSFPSGHTMGSMTLAFVMGYLVVRAPWKTGWRIAAVFAWAAYALLVGVSRVYLGVHWPSDVIAAWLLGGALAVFATGLYESRRLRLAERGVGQAQQVRAD